VEQLTHSPGNLRVLWQYFLHPGEGHVGLRAATDTVLVQLDPWRMATGRIFFEQLRVKGATLPGVLTLLVWAASFAAAQRRSVPRTLRTFHWTVAVALGTGWLSIGRIPGSLFWYLMLWGWVNALMVLVAVVWTAVTLARPVVARHSARAGRAFVTALVALAVAVGLAAIGALTADVTTTTLGRPDPVLDRAVPTVVRALDQAGRHRPVIVVWTELEVGGPGREMVNELARRGFDVGALAPFAAEMTRYHTATPHADSVVVVMAARGERARWAARPGVRRIGTIRDTPAGPVDLFIAPAATLT
jgi:hypothetical protein